MNYEQRIQHSKEIIENNKYILYHLPAGYKNLEIVLRHGGIRDTLLKIFKYIKDKEIFIYRRRYVFFLDNKRITQIRGRTTESVSNRYINYLCAVGLINKQYQNIGEFGNVETTQLTDINYDFLLDTGKRRPVNTFYFRAYTCKELCRLDNRCKRLIDGKVTPGNISFNMLCANGLKKMANEVYYANSRESIVNKERSYKELLKGIESILNQRGYTTKQEVIERLKLQRGEFDGLYRIFRTDFKSRFTYKAPCRAEREALDIAPNSHKWIITLKGV